MQVIVMLLECSWIWNVHKGELYSNKRQEAIIIFFFFLPGKEEMERKMEISKSSSGLYAIYLLTFQLG